MKFSKHFNVIICIIFLFMGLFFAGNQMLVHHVSSNFAANNVELGLMIGAMYVGSLLMVLVLGEVSARIGKRLGAVIAAICYSAGALFVALAGSVKLSIVAFLIFGCGTGGIEGMLFSLIGDYNGEDTNKVMNISQAFFSIGAVVGPLLFEQMLKTVPYRYAYGVMWLIMGAIAVTFWLARSVESFTKRDDSTEKGLSIFKLVRNPAMIIYMLVLMISIGCESSVTYWLATYFDVLGAVGLGTLGLSIYWISSIPGRLVGATAKNRGRYLAVSYIVATVGILLLLLIPDPKLKFIGICVMGVALAPVYPSISTLGASLFPKKTASAFSLMVFSSGLGGALAQPIIGAISEASSITTVYGAIAVVMLILSGMMVLGGKFAKSHKA